MYSPNTPFEQAHDTAQKLTAEMTASTHIQDVHLRALIGAWAMGSHVIIEATYGTGKTTMAKALAQAAGGISRRVQGTSDVMPSDITGGLIFNQKTGEFEFNRGPIFANVVLADELQRMPERSQSGLTEAMQEGQVTPAGSAKTYQLPQPQLVIATRNADGAVAPNILDRFGVGIRFPNQTAGDRSAVLAKKKAGHVAQTVVEPGEIINLQQETAQIATGPEVEAQANDVIDETFGGPEIDPEDSIMGGSRALLQILDLAKYAALSEKRRNVSPADIAFAARFVLEHRVAVDYKHLRHITPAQIVERSIKAVVQ